MYVNVRVCWSMVYEESTPEADETMQQWGREMGEIERNREREGKEERMGGRRSDGVCGIGRRVVVVVVKKGAMERGDRDGCVCVCV